MMHKRDPIVWRRIRAVFEDLSDQPCEQRERELARLGATEPEFGAEVRSLFDSEQSADAELCVDAPALHRDLLEHERNLALLGIEVCGYRLESILGRGGTATVFRGTRIDSGEGVAIKVLAEGLGTRRVLGRFRQERDLLEALDHPGLIRVFDAGEVAPDRPFLVTELVDGVPIDTFCEGLDRRACLRLFVEVCHAVHHAHRHLVVHRDLKPSNILVQTDGTPKVLDFGIAKLLSARHDAGWTDHGVRGPYTLAFASPEQVRGGAITTSSDIYSLGVLLYLLLVGRDPYGVPASDRGALEAAVLEAPPLPPNAAGGGVLPRDLTTLLSCALGKDSRTRYPSAEHLAEDIERYLAHRPLRARREPWHRAVAKTARRHPVGVAAIVGALALVGGDAIGSRRSAADARASESLAWRAHSNAALAANMLAGVLERLGSSTLARGELEELLGPALARLDDLDGVPEAEARLRIAVAGALRSAGAIEDATTHFRRALELTRSTRGLSRRDRVHCLRALLDLLPPEHPERPGLAAELDANSDRDAPGSD